MLIGIEWTMGIIGFAVYKHLTLIASVDTCDLGDQSRLTGTIFADKTANLTAFEFEVNVIICASGAKVFAKAMDFKNDIVSHFMTPFTFLCPMIANTTINIPRQASCRVPEGTPIMVKILNTA